MSAHYLHAEDSCKPIKKKIRFPTKKDTFLHQQAIFQGKNRIWAQFQKDTTGPIATRLRFGRITKKWRTNITALQLYIYPPFLHTDSTPPSAFYTYFCENIESASELAIKRFLQHKDILQTLYRHNF